MAGIEQKHKEWEKHREQELGYYCLVRLICDTCGEKWTEYVGKNFQGRRCAPTKCSQSGEEEQQERGNTMEYAEVTVKVKIPVGDWGPLLVADDSECYPIVHYGPEVTSRFREMLGWNKEIADQLARQAGRESFLADWYQRWEELAQEWAMRKMGVDPTPICDRCRLPVRDEEPLEGLHRSCYERWQRHRRLVDELISRGGV
jgi:hypothetical protein